MSRTFKDRPYWVKTNDPKNLEVITYHHHTRFGRKLEKSFPVKDENGERVTKEVEFTTYFSKETHTVTVDVYESRLIGYHSTECDAHEPENGGHYSESLRNCGHYLRLHNYGSPTSYEKTEKHRATRARERNLLKNIIKLEEVEDEDEVFHSKENLTNYWARRY